MMSTPMPMIIDGFELRECGQIRLVVSQTLERAGFINAFSTRSGGVSPLPENSLSLGNLSQDEKSNVLENRRRLLTALGTPGWPMVTARQIHSATIHCVATHNDAVREATTCDALVGNLPATILAVQTADCLPVLIGDPVTGAFAAVHAGWRGSLQGIVARTVETMQQTHRSKPSDLIVAMGPAIGECCFEVGPEVVSAFCAVYPYAEQCFSRRQANGKAQLNLNRMNIQQLIDAGVASVNISDAALCTVCHNDLFFSYRKERGAERPIGRLMGAIGQRPRFWSNNEV